jgi:AcrR family transcriptional regulator
MTATTAPTRERLLEAARDLIEEGGYGGASVIAITARAGLAAGTLYRHFGSKEELFVEVFRSVCDRELQAMQAAAHQDGVPQLVRLENVLLTFAQRALRRPRLAWALLAEPVDPLVDAERLAYRARYAALVADGLREAIAKGELPAQHVDLTAAALVGACGEALVGPLSPQQAPPISEVLEALKAFVRRAVGAPPCSGGAAGHSGREEVEARAVGAPPGSQGARAWRPGQWRRQEVGAPER